MLEVPSWFDTAQLDAAVHLVSLVVVEACRPLLDGAHRPRLGLKWPNDIYIASGTGATERFEKVGGVLGELIPEPVSEEQGPRGTRRILIGQVFNFDLQDG
jgi:biotin-(acetyl-CoA carboxylase) ligase